MPTLLVQGTADTLFTPSEAIRNFELLKASGVPVHMLWFCGGHGVCLTQGDNSRVEARVVGWLRRWLMDDHAADARSDLRVAGRRRPVAQRARLAAGAGTGA